jgi:hypothetical protein
MATQAPEAIDEQLAHDIGVEAYIYLYPLVTMDITRKQIINTEVGKGPAAGPMNTFSHIRAFPPADFRVVVRPNFDTLYSPAWLDVTAEPVIVSVPDTHGRYYLLPLYDMWTDVFASPGWRTSGTTSARFALVPPNWQGTLPDGVEPIPAPTPYVAIVGRTQTNGPADYDAVHQVQDGFAITPLSRWGMEPEPVSAPIDPTVDTKTEPLRLVNAMPAAQFFRYGAELMTLHPPHITDWSQLARMRRIGLKAGSSFDAAALNPSIRQALEIAPAAALRKMQARVATLARVVNGWSMNTDTMGAYGDFYMKRACVALVGLFANQEVDAVYPLAVSDADGKPLTGDNDYVLHFEQHEIPPASAFWSVTMYDAEGFQAANPLNRFAIGDRDPVQYNADGSLDLYLQHESPGRQKEANWLPSPRGPLGITMRIYAPKPGVLDGTWSPPPIRPAR